MKAIVKSLLCTISVAMIGGGVSYASANTFSQEQLQKMKQRPSAFSAPAAKSNLSFLKGGNFRDSRVLTTSEDPDYVPLTASVWGVIEGPNGQDWIYTQETTLRTGTWSEIESSVVTIMDENHQQAGQFTITIPEGQVVNDIQPFGRVTNRFFDYDQSSYEVLCYINEVPEPGVVNGRMDAYSFDGTLKQSYPASAALFLDASTSSWSTYYRYVLVNYDYNDEGVEMCNIQVLAPASWSSSDPTIEFTTSFEANLLDYTSGPFVNAVTIDNNPYIAVSHYEQPYSTGYDPDNWMPIFNDNNNYIVEVYDRNYDKVAETSIPVEINETAYYSLYNLGYFSSNDICLGDYSGDDQFNFIITRENWIITTDGTEYDISVYDESGNEIKTIAENATTWQMLSSVPGESEQVAIMMGGDGENEEMRMIDLPSCEHVVTFPGVLEGNLLTTSIDRYPVGDSYQYVIALGDALLDGEDVITRVGWYNKDTSLDHFVNINLGPNGTYAQHAISAAFINPYLFNTDDQHEYVLIASMSNGDGTTDNVLCIANDEGNIIRQFRGDDTKGQYYNGNVLNINSTSPKLMVVYYDFSKSTIEMYDLPFSKFEGGGDGTAENPYKIATAGDLNMVRDNLSACYVLTNDIDMSGFMGSFTPIEEFAGTLDGAGYCINNLTLGGNDAYQEGLIGSSYSCTVKDLTINNANVTLTSNSSFSGILIGYAAGATIDNVHINNATITGDASVVSVTGSLVGMAANTIITSSSANNIVIDLPGSRNVGGLVGQSSTDTSFDAVSVTGTITGDRNLGGIVGAANYGTASITNSYAVVNIEGSYAIGGIAGSSTRALIDHCYSKGTLTANSSDWSGFASIGGIVGTLSEDWSGSSEPVISNCAAAIEAINAPEEAQAVGRIVGYTINYTEWMPGETPIPENGLTNNYAIAEMTINGAAISNTDDTTENGADVATSELNTEFFINTLGFAFGETLAEPWKATMSLPILYYEDKATNLTLSVESSEVETGLITVAATVEGTTADRIVFTSSDETIATVESVAVDGNTATATINLLQSGEVTITATIDGCQASCTLNVTSGVNDLLATAFTITYDGKAVSATGATRIEVYSINGMRVAAVNGDYVEVGNLTAGTYIVRATDDNTTATTKFIKK